MTGVPFLIFITVFLFIIFVLPLILAGILLKRKGAIRWPFVIILGWVGLIVAIFLPDKDAPNAAGKRRYFVYFLIFCILVVAIYLLNVSLANFDTFYTPENSTQATILQSKIEKLIDAWCVENSNITELMKKYNEKYKFKKVDESINVLSENIELKDAGSYLIPDTKTSLELIELLRVSVAENVVFVAIYGNIKEKRFKLCLYLKKDKGTELLLSDDDEWGTKPEVYFKKLGKDSITVIQTNYVVCSCGGVGGVYYLTDTKKLEKVFDLNNEHSACSFVDLNNDKVCEIVGDQSFIKSEELTKKIQKTYGNALDKKYFENYMLYKKTIYIWDGKKFQITGESFGKE